MTEKELAERLASMPLSHEDLTSTWVPPDWEEIVEWWDQFVADARKITGKSYR